MNDSEYARFHTEQRVGLTKGNPKELEQWANVFIFDIYGMVVELQKDDPNNLYRRLIQIKAPIFLAFGANEPFIPGTSLNGLWISRATSSCRSPSGWPRPETVQW
jgi:homoserine O-acetyltransferase